MLVEIKVKNFAIIECLSFELGVGLNIISGETGSGKSVILKSLSLLMGEKASSETVKVGADQASIEGYFDLHNRPDVSKKLKEMGLAGEENELIARRVITNQGKGRVYLNGHLCNLNDLREVISPLLEINGYNPPLIEMTGQHESKALLDKTFHIDILDRFSNCLNLRNSFEIILDEYRNLMQELEKLKEQNLNREQRLDFLKYQQKEITTLELTENFEKEIEENYLKAKNFHSLAAFTDKLDVTLYSGDEAIVDKLQSILHEAQDKFADFMLSKKVDLISNAKSQIEEFVFEVREWQRELTDNPIDVDSIEEKMSKWRKIQKKYGQTANEVLMVLKDIEKEIDQLENFDQHQNIIEEKCIKLKFELTEIAEALHKERVKSALILIKKVNEELKDLNMKGVQFGIQINKMDHFNNRGNSDVEFTIQVSKEDKARSLNKIASGGELSRILLSLKRVTGSSELPRTYLFDEVDTGVSGETAEKVGSKLKAISKGQQVVCVTHLPQVAVFADNHFVISKIQKGKKVDMEIKRLERKEREEEIARLISGTKVTSSSIQHAKQLLNQVR